MNGKIKCTFSQESHLWVGFVRARLQFILWTQRYRELNPTIMLLPSHQDIVPQADNIKPVCFPSTDVLSFSHKTLFFLHQHFQHSSGLLFSSLWPPEDILSSFPPLMSVLNPKETYFKPKSLCSLLLLVYISLWNSGNPLPVSINTKHENKHHPSWNMTVTVLEQFHHIQKWQTKGLRDTQTSFFSSFR